jgi:hypothetical protein
MRSFIRLALLAVLLLVAVPADATYIRIQNLGPSSLSQGLPLGAVAMGFYFPPYDPSASGVGPYDFVLYSQEYEYFLSGMAYQENLYFPESFTYASPLLPGQSVESSLIPQLPNVINFNLMMLGTSGAGYGIGIGGLDAYFTPDSTSFVVDNIFFHLQFTFLPGSPPASVPDPGSTLLLFGVGLVGLRAWRKRRQ